MDIQSSLLNLPPGMYILRYPQAGSVAPLSIARAPGGPGTLEQLSTPGTGGNVLRSPADCIVVLVGAAPVTLLVSAFMPAPGMVAPVLRVDQVGLTADVASAPAPAPAPAPAMAAAAPTSRPITIGAHGISLIGHIERTGDVVAAQGEVLGDAADQLRLEGFQVMWPDRPDGVDLAYGVGIEGMGPMPIVQTGAFCGTRGQGRRITHVTLTLVGPQADAYALDGEACFSGGFRMALRSGLALTGPSGLEHLTALRLRAVPAKQASAAANPWTESARTVVFKAPPAPSKKPPAASPAGARARATSKH